MATVYVLLGFDTLPPQDASEEWRLTHYCGIARAVAPRHLPHGMFEQLGMHEEMTWFEEIVVSESYDDAIRGSRRWVHDNVGRFGSGAEKERERIDRQVMRNRIMLLDAGIMDDDEIERLDLEEPGWRSPGQRWWLASGG